MTTARIIEIIELHIRQCEREVAHFSNPWNDEAIKHISIKKNALHDLLDNINLEINKENDNS